MQFWRSDKVVLKSNTNPQLSEQNIHTPVAGVLVSPMMGDDLGLANFVTVLRFLSQCEQADCWADLSVTVGC